MMVTSSAHVSGWSPPARSSLTLAYALAAIDPPFVTETLEVAQRVRQYLMGIHARIAGGPAAVSWKFSGKDRAGVPLSGHRHAFILPMDLDQDGRLDHLVVYCREPFDDAERAALSQLERVWLGGGRFQVSGVRCQGDGSAGASDGGCQTPGEPVAEFGYGAPASVPAGPVTSSSRLHKTNNVASSADLSSSVREPAGNPDGTPVRVEAGAPYAIPPKRGHFARGSGVRGQPDCGLRIADCGFEGRGQANCGLRIADCGFDARFQVSGVRGQGDGLSKASHYGDEGLEIRFAPVDGPVAAGLFAPSRVLTSTTPFVPPRHYRKGRGDFQEWLAGEVRREAGYHGLPAPVSITPVNCGLRIADCGFRTAGAGGAPARSLHWLEFRRNRKGDRIEIGYGFELKFAEPVAGPVALGYGCHFGLGQFRSVDPPGSAT